MLTLGNFFVTAFHTVVFPKKLFATAWTAGVPSGGQTASFDKAIPTAIILN